MWLRVFLFMATIVMAVYCTDENDKLKYFERCLKSIENTVDFKKHHLILYSNNSNRKTLEVLQNLKLRISNSFVWYCSYNKGTAGAINECIQQARSKNQFEVIIKCDDDVEFHQKGWVEELEQVFIDTPKIGICGLKRDDVTGNFTENGKLLMSDDIMGTCTALNPKLLDAIGYYRQFSTYGFDDVLMSCRSIAAGFKNCFLPHIKISHLDEGGTEYTEWKKREAQQYIQEVGMLCDAYLQGKAPIYYDGGF